MVSSLIDPVSNWWNVELVRALFFPFEAEVILKIPLCHNLLEDNFIWIGNKRGVFTFKSAYFIAAKVLGSMDMGEYSSGDPFAQIWKKVWSLKLPPKIRIFSWRACVNGLPVRSKMATKGILTSCICPVCDEETENLSHALISCEFALSVWSLWQDCPIEMLMNVTDFNDLVLHFCSPLLEKHLDFFFAIAWSIWHNRNKIIHDEHGLPPNQIWDLAKSIVGEFNVASSWDFSIGQSPLLGWAAPSLGFAKVNVDGACSIDGSGISSVGVIIRDEFGSVIAALCKALPSHFSTEWTEFLALE